MKNNYLSRTKILMSLIGLASFSAFASDKKSDLKVGTVDVQGAILLTEEGKSARDKMEKEVNQKKQDLMKQQDQLKKMNDDFLAQQSILSEADKQTKQKDFQAKLQQFQQAQMNFEQDARQKESTVLGQIFQNMQVEIQKIAAQKKFDMVFDKSAGVLLYSTNVVDITKEVVDLYNKDYKVK